MPLDAYLASFATSLQERRSIRSPRTPASKPSRCSSHFQFLGEYLDQ